MTEEKEKTTTHKGVTRRQFIAGTVGGVVVGAAAGAVAGSLGFPTIPTSVSEPWLPTTWDYTADVVIVGAGATGLPAAVQAIESGASVIMIEKNFDVGGEGLICGAFMGIGGGTAIQNQLGIKDSPDLLFNDLTGEGLTGVNFDYMKFNDRDIARAYADLNVDTFNWLVAHGVNFIPHDVTNFIGLLVGPSFSINRTHQASWTEQGTAQTPGTLYNFGTGGSGGAGVFRPLEAVARSKGVQVLLNYQMTKVIRETPSSGRVLGVSATYAPRSIPGKPTPVPSFASHGNIDSTTPTINVRANKAVIIATGGVKSNVQLRRVFDPRLTEEYQASGEPWISDSGDGIIAAQEVGAQLCSDDLPDGEEWITKRSALGCRYCITAAFLPGDPVYPLLRASGFSVADYQDCILVKSSGLRFFDETNTDPAGTNANFLDAALANGGGPIWAIFDSDAVQREKWSVTPPTVDPELFFSGNTIAELASKIIVPADMFPVTNANFQPVPASALQDTVTKYNSYVDAGKDPDFEKPTPKYKIQTPPFYAAWATPILHDTRSGLRINDKAQVLDINGNVIPSLYSGGEAVGGLSILGIVRAIIEGRIAAMNAVLETSTT